MWWSAIRETVHVIACQYHYCHTCFSIREFQTVLPNIPNFWFLNHFYQLFPYIAHSIKLSHWRFMAWVIFDTIYLIQFYTTQNDFWIEAVPIHQFTLVIISNANSNLFLKYILIFDVMHSLGNTECNVFNEGKNKTHRKRQMTNRGKQQRKRSHVCSWKIRVKIYCLSYVSPFGSVLRDKKTSMLYTTRFLFWEFRLNFTYTYTVRLWTNGNRLIRPSHSIFGVYIYIWRNQS